MFFVMKPHGYTVLLADDSANERFLFETVSTQLGIRHLNTVSCGEEAIAYLLGEGEYADRSRFPFPSFLVLDINMPPGDGFEVLQAMKDHPDISIVPVIVLTSSANPEYIKRAYRLGANSVLCKPATLQELRHLLAVTFQYWNLCQVPKMTPSGAFPHARRDAVGHAPQFAGCSTDTETHLP